MLLVQTVALVAVVPAFVVNTAPVCVPAYTRSLESGEMPHELMRVAKNCPARVQGVAGAGTAVAAVVRDGSAPPIHIRFGSEGSYANGRVNK